MIETLFELNANASVQQEGLRMMQTYNRSHVLSSSLLHKILVPRCIIFWCLNCIGMLALVFGRNAILWAFA